MNAITKSTLPLIALGLLCSSHAGDITGRVTLKGTPPPERMVDLNSQPRLGAKYPKGLTTRHYQLSPDGGLEYVLVYVRGDFTNTRFDPPSTTPVLDHADGLFQPYVMGIRTGQELRLKCSDGTSCTFTTFPKANRAFAISIPPHVDSVARTFAEPEVAVWFKDDLHPWNYAYVGVFAHPFFAVTETQGRFTIRGVPAGRYTVEVFHPKAGTSAKPIVVTDEATTVDFEVTPR